MISRIQIALVCIGVSFTTLSLQAENTDVVVIGSTPGGVSAAIAAARNGQQVTLLSYNDHLGGMMTSGLGKSDIEKRSMIQGIFKEFIDRIHTEYIDAWGAEHENVKLCREGYYYEPSVAEHVLDEMTGAEPSLTVMKGWRLISAEVKQNRLTSIQAENRHTHQTRTFTAKVFIDATYEGDLYAAAGAEYRLGREARTEFDEPHAGVIYFDYQAKKFLPGTTGEADELLPAYTYRLCLTTNPDNSVQLTGPPPEYDRNNYLFYFEDLEAGRLAGPKVFKPGRGYNPLHFDTLVRALSVTTIPNGKTDVNINPRPLGFPFVELNRGYIEGDEETRNRIREQHRNLTLGLIWFLQHDPQVPEEHRRLANELHFPRDEFTDTDHFPFQLYVREGRRLVGEYILTEHDITGTGEDHTPRKHKDSIAVGEFPIDSFPCRKRQPTDTIVLEGYLGMLDHITRPYEIPYRVMIPKKVDGLIVPVAASTTHVGFSSIRMEPTWMALGQAAGTAAALSVKNNLSPRQIEIAQLQTKLAEQGQVINHQQAAKPDPVKNPSSPLMLAADWVPEKTHDIDFDNLPKVPGEHVLLNDVRPQNGVNQHNYLVHFNGNYWAMWSDGPGVEDQVGQRVKFSTSQDGLHWNKPRYMTPIPPNSGPDSPYYGKRTLKGYRWISRGFWPRDGKLYALASLDEAKHFFGPSLELHLFELDPTAENWNDKGVIVKNAINNFPPQKIPTGEWLMSRRKHDYKKNGVEFLVGGIKGIDQWESYPVLGSSSELSAEEPLWWALPDQNLMALFRDNRKSGYLYRSFSIDNGKTWSTPVKTNFPDATSKLHGLRLTDGRYVLVSNANPKRRDPLVLSISEDGIVFNKMGYLVGGRRVDYPHVLEQDGHLLVAFSGGKQTVEVIKIKLSDLEHLNNK